MFSFNEVYVAQMGRESFHKPARRPNHDPALFASVRRRCEQLLEQVGSKIKHNQRMSPRKLRLNPQ